MSDREGAPHGGPRPLREFVTALEAPQRADRPHRYQKLCGVPGRSDRPGYRRLYSNDFGGYVDFASSTVRFEEEVPPSRTSVAGVRVWVDVDTPVRMQRVLATQLLRGDLTVPERLRLAVAETRRCLLIKSRSAWKNPGSTNLDL